MRVLQSVPRAVKAWSPPGMAGRWWSLQEAGPGRAFRSWGEPLKGQWDPRFLLSPALLLSHEGTAFPTKPSCPDVPASPQGPRTHPSQTGPPSLSVGHLRSWSLWLQAAAQQRSTSRQLSMGGQQEASMDEAGGRAVHGWEERVKRWVGGEGAGDGGRAGGPCVWFSGHWEVGVGVLARCGCQLSVPVTHWGDNREEERFQGTVAWPRPLGLGARCSAVGARGGGLCTRGK